MKARFYRCDGEDVICCLCPRRCRIAPGEHFMLSVLNSDRYQPITLAS